MPNASIACAAGSFKKNGVSFVIASRSALNRFFEPTEVAQARRKAVERPRKIGHERFGLIVGKIPVYVDALLRRLERLLGSVRDLPACLRD